MSTIPLNFEDTTIQPGSPSVRPPELHLIGNSLYLGSDLVGKLIDDMPATMRHAVEDRINQIEIPALLDGGYDKGFLDGSTQAREKMALALIERDNEIAKLKRELAETQRAMKYPSRVTHGPGEMVIMALKDSV